MNILKTSSYSKNVENMLNSYGNEPILKIVSADNGMLPVAAKKVIIN